MTLYTKIRPKTFDEVKGQEFTVNNLRMQSIRDKFFQVIILAGQYGAGKTTLARIVATAANCKNKDKNGNPCGTSAQPDLPEESVPVLITPSKTSEVAQTETTDFDALFGDWGFDSFDNTDEPGFFESAEETGTSFQETATVSETSAALSAGELAQKSLSERISNDPVIKEKLLSAEWITQEENLLLKVLPEYKEDILLFIAASGIKNITIC